MHQVDAESVSPPAFHEGDQRGPDFRCLPAPSRQANDRLGGDPTSASPSVALGILLFGRADLDRHQPPPLQAAQNALLANGVNQRRIGQIRNRDASRRDELHRVQPGHEGQVGADMAGLVHTRLEEVVEFEGKGHKGPRKQRRQGKLLRVPHSRAKSLLGTHGHRNPHTCPIRTLSASGSAPSPGSQAHTDLSHGGERFGFPVCPDP